MGLVDLTAGKEDDDTKTGAFEEGMGDRGSGVPRSSHEDRYLLFGVSKVRHQTRQEASSDVLESQGGPPEELQAMDAGLDLHQRHLEADTAREKRVEIRGVEVLTEQVMHHDSRDGFLRLVAQAVEEGVRQRFQPTRHVETAVGRERVEDRLSERGLGTVAASTDEPHG